MSSGVPVQGTGDDKGKLVGDPSPEGSESQKVGQMAEQAREGDKEAPKLRGDGTPLVESDRPKNPKKRMWEEKPLVDQEKGKDEL